MNLFDWPVRIYIEDTDAGGIVYHANYLRYMERARTEWLRSMDIGQEILRQQGILLVVTAIDVKYRKPARLDDELNVSVQVDKVGKARLHISHLVSRINNSGEHERLVTANVVIATMNFEGKPMALPAIITTRMQDQLSAAGNSTDVRE
ncbi:MULTISPECIES: YbgC/FadM family acyl-CoA thioesterase [unclassified Oceanobacter]|jgi:tol-pal system-associated acyl-CoA thioesterase|uniref:YbgC/FadM family acyl-CoA thioesterase n=1 Tax=unclassified Oceanobacter TaxID=2620260 RepID=UPI0026E43389|nr:MULTISPECIES: YbgC/FadM family acyl-CoA thioesterase [unclassified Oceanobacter]MDO6682787.1 YbgC/FadM family acyl-CoA thioesterase [Oceanobacter sp. 5_MG-2023]MDP2504859.1 YbgC/FadM family acyl-CoA thioesterase [Oceanobacter sp. 3_MG-2023]MDP2546303.1 YbgC/FadM family acyl-CoA thioesterase [Oceanobacter sp. 4_MG-2023]MDP2607604.1 YbgC/FadM family acyl-CoA thioesterase [Oceanobacter sp. 1_MG-2023]MDP2610872.1 YbgC/FadM family acyl-CoA thioesterase [Oceanobacter sp. 2_MG-2023]